MSAHFLGGLTGAVLAAYVAFIAGRSLTRKPGILKGGALVLVLTWAVGVLLYTVLKVIAAGNA